MESLLRALRSNDILEELELVDCFEAALTERVSQSFAKYFTTTKKLAKFKLKITLLVVTSEWSKESLLLR